jgi:hypothetical protein
MPGPRKYTQQLFGKYGEHSNDSGIETRCLSKSTSKKSTAVRFQSNNPYANFQKNKTISIERNESSNNNMMMLNLRPKEAADAAKF